MFEQDPFSASARRLSWPGRFVLVGCGITLAGLLSVAGVLQPERRGSGTHQQLGLPPCSIQTWFQVRCPSCGMTTSWAHFVRGQWLSAARANAGGTLLAATAALALPWCLGSAWKGRWWGICPSEGVVVGFSLAAVGVTLAEWLVRVLWMPFG